jgi:hypothetical protein
MATKLEEANIAPADNAGLVEGTGSDKQPDQTPVAEPSEKKLDNATQAVGDLSLADKEGDTQEPKPEAAAPPTSTPAPTTDTVQPTTGPFWPETAPEHPLTKFYDIFEELVKEAQHDEVYGIQLAKSSPFLTKLILQKFLRANQNDLDKAKQQLLETLKWRKEFDPVKAASESFDKARFGGLGYVLEVEGVPESKNAKDIATFNIYGAVKDKKATFGDLEGYVAFISLQRKVQLLTATCTASSAGASASWRNPSRNSTFPPLQPPFPTSAKVLIPTKVSRSTIISKSRSCVRIQLSKPRPRRLLRCWADTTRRRCRASSLSMCRL